MISMCGNCSAKLVLVMDGHRPQIRCEVAIFQRTIFRRSGSHWDVYD